MLALVLAMALGCGDLCAADALSHYAELLRVGGYGRLPTERAAFLIRESDGTITMSPWEHSGFQRAVFRGSVPQRTIAIVHTHPLAAPKPSAGDRQTAAGLGIPVIVVTPERVVAAMPEGAVVVLVGDRSWWSITRTINSLAVRTPVPASGTARGPRGRRTFLPR